MILFTAFQDPELPQTLEELHVIEEEFIKIDKIESDEYIIKIEFTPTVPHCSLATLIGKAFDIQLFRRGFLKILTFLLLNQLEKRTWPDFDFWMTSCHHYQETEGNLHK